jgi:hypothetical protein
VVGKRRASRIVWACFAFGLTLIFGVALSVELARAKKEHACNSGDGAMCKKLCARWGSDVCGSMALPSGRAFCTTACSDARP